MAPPSSCGRNKTKGRAEDTVRMLPWTAAEPPILMDVPTKPRWEMVAVSAAIVSGWKSRDQARGRGRGYDDEDGHAHEREADREGWRVVENGRVWLPEGPTG
jgi:hypothetical protein